jgi:hypothetical protein
VKDFVQAKVDSAKKAVTDTLASLRKQLELAAKEELRRRLLGIKDTAVVANDSTYTPVKNPQQKATESVKGLLENLLRKKKKDSVQLQVDTLKKQ